MALITVPNPLTDGTIALGSQVIADINVIANDYNGNITNANLAANAGIVDTKLAQITTGAKVSGAALTGLASLPAGAGVIPVANLPGTSGPMGQCRLTKSAANLLLSPYNGNQLTIAGSNYSIPAAGVTLAPPATTLTSYFIYAYMNTGTMTLEYSATGHTTDSTSGNIGVEIKSGDNTRTLVGQARTVSSAWVDTAAQRFVTSWFNRQRLVGTGTFSTDRSVASTTYGEINSEVQVQFMAWAVDSTYAGVTGSVSATNKGSNTAVAFDSASSIEPTMESACYAAGAIDNPIGINGYKVLAEGYHYATLLGASTGTSTWRAASSGSVNSAKVYLTIGVLG